jgi:hypothetical protein
MYDRKTLFNLSDNVSWSTMNYSYGEHKGSAILIYKDNYKIPKNGTSYHDKLEQETFKIDNNLLFNPIASCIANILDDDKINCITGDCSFVFEDNTNFTEGILHELIQNNSNRI